MSIRRLPSELVNRIAAGEVVERPASALKELVENGLDAGATAVSVRLAAGGLELIEVADDGCGMAPGEMALALERHATSKLPSDAIDRITSFGFRGEALPSIASVSRLTLESRVRGSDGWRIAIDHGAAAGEGPAALPPGTRVRVEGLFDKVPARRKFLRSPRAEYAACLDVVRRLAMARSDVAFTLDHDGRRVLTLQPGDPPGRVAALLTHELDRHGIGIDCARDGLGLTGVISLPTFNRGLADQQFLFVNARPVKDRLLVGALRAAYRDLIARDRHPIAALFLQVPLDEVDVNVHPAKTEVRFRDPAAVRGLIVGGLRAALDEASQKSATQEQAAAPVLWTTSATYDEQLNRVPQPPAQPQWAPSGAASIVAEARALFDYAPAARAEPASPLRLLYVGLTRARVHLSVTWSLARTPGGRATNRPPRFLDGLRPPVASDQTLLEAMEGKLAAASRTPPALAGALAAEALLADAASMQPNQLFMARQLVPHAPEPSAMAASWMAMIRTYAEQRNALRHREVELLDHRPRQDQIPRAAVTEAGRDLDAVGPRRAPEHRHR